MYVRRGDKDVCSCALIVEFTLFILKLGSYLQLKGL